MSDSELSGEVKESQEHNILKSDMIATFGDKQIKNQQIEHLSYQQRSQLGNQGGGQQKDIQQIYQFDSGKIQNPFYIDQNQFIPANNNFNNNFITQNIDFQYQQDDKVNYAPKSFPEKDKYQLGGNFYQQKINNYANNEGDIAIMMNSSIQSAHSQQIINNDISDEENERRLANNFQISGSSLSPDFKIDTVKSTNLHNTSNNLKQKESHLQGQEINQWKDEHVGYEEQNEQKRNCDSCHVIPANYIALPCSHNFCINCLMKIYLNPMLCRKDFDNFAELVCQICSKPTKLDYESQIAIETEIQQLLINSMNDQNPLQMISNPNLQFEDNNQQGSREDLNSSENQSIKEQIQKKDAKQFQSANNYLQMYDQQNQDNKQQQQQVQQYFQQRYQMPKEEVIHEEESMETFLTNETHKLIHFNSSDSPYQSLPKSSFQNKQHLTKSAYSSNQASQNGNILTNSLLKVLHNNNSNNLNNNEKNNIQNLQNIQQIQFSDFKKSLENYNNKNNNENNFLQFQNDDQEFQVKNLMLTEESEGIESEKKNISGISPIASNNNKNQGQQNVLKTESEQNQDISNNNILEFRRVESDLSNQGNNIFDQDSQQENNSVVINREKPQFIQSQYIAEDKGNLVHSNVRLLNSIQQSKDLAHLNQIYSQNLKKQETQTPYTPSDLNLLHSIQQSQDLQSSYQANSQKVSKMETPVFSPQNFHLLHSIQQSKDLQNLSHQNSNQNQQQNLNQLNSVHSNIQLLHSIQDISSSASNKISQKQTSSQNSADNKFQQVKEQIKQVNSSNLIPGEDDISQQNQKRNLLVSEYIPMEKVDESASTPQVQSQNNKDNISSSQQNSYMRLTQTNKSANNPHQIQSNQDKEQNLQHQHSVQQAQPQSLNSSSQASKQDSNINNKLVNSKILDQEQNQQQQQKQTLQTSQNNYESRFLRTREQIKSGGKISYRSSRNSKSESMTENQLMQSLESNNINALSTNCNEHPLEDAQLFCFTCECKCICLACQADSIKHNGHQVEYVTRSYDILQVRLQETHQDISNKIELMDSTYWNFSQQKINVQKKNEEMQQQILQTFNGLRDLIKLKENELLQQLSQHQANALQIVDQECNKMQEARKTLETVSGKLNIIQNAQPSELVELSDCTIAFNYYAECKRILNEIISKTKIDQEPIKQFENTSLGIVQQIADQVKICINEIKFPQPQRDLRLSPQSNRFISSNFQLNNYTPQHQSITTIEEVINQNGNQIFNKLNQNKTEISSNSKENLANLESIAKFKQILHNNSTQKNISNTNSILLDRKDQQTPQTKQKIQTNLDHQNQQPTKQDIKLQNNFVNENSYNTSESQRNQINIEPSKSSNNSYFLYNSSARSNQPKSQKGGYFLSANTDQSDKQALSSINKLRMQNNFSPCSVDNSKSIDQIEQRIDAYQIASTDQNRNSFDLKDNVDIKFSNQNASQQESGYASKIQQSYPKLKISQNHLQDEIDKINNSLFELQANIDLNTIFCRTEHSPLKEKNEYLVNYSERQQKLNSNRIPKKSSPSHYQNQQINASSLNSLKQQVLSPTTASSIQKFFKNFQQKYDQKSGQSTQQNFSVKNNINNNSEGRQVNNLKLSNSIFSYSKKINEQNQNSSVKKEIRSKYQHHKHLSDIKLNSISIGNDASNQSNILSPKPLLKDLDFQLYSNKSNKDINFNFNTTQQPSDNMLYLPEQSVIEKLSAFQQDIKNSSIFQKELRMKEIDWMKSKTITLLKKSETHFQSQHALNEQDQPNYIIQKPSITPSNYRSNSNINLSKLSINSTTNQFNTSSNSQYIQNNNYHSEGRQSCLSSNNNLRSITPQQSSPTANYFNKATYNSSKQNINNYQSGQYSQKRLQKPKSFTSRNLLSMFDKSPSNNFLVLNQEKVLGEAKQFKNFGNNNNNNHQNLIESFNLINNHNGNLNMNNKNNSLI